MKEQSKIFELPSLDVAVCVKDVWETLKDQLEVTESSFFYSTLLSSKNVVLMSMVT